MLCEGGSSTSIIKAWGDRVAPSRTGTPDIRPPAMNADLNGRPPCWSETTEAVLQEVNELDWLAARKQHPLSRRA
jgi:hypothetical protein